MCVAPLPKACLSASLYPTSWLMYHQISDREAVSPRKHGCFAGLSFQHFIQPLRSSPIPPSHSSRATAGAQTFNIPIQVSSCQSSQPFLFVPLVIGMPCSRRPEPLGRQGNSSGGNGHTLWWYNETFVDGSGMCKLAGASWLS